MRTLFKLKISGKLIIGFGVVFVIVAISAIFMYRMIGKSQEATDEIKRVILPSVTLLTDLSDHISESKILIKHWTESASQNTPQKKRLITLTDTIFPKTLDSISLAQNNWDEYVKRTTVNQTSQTRAYLLQIKKIMTDLDSLGKYNDLYLTTRSKADVEEGNALMELADETNSELRKLIGIQQAKLYNKTTGINQSLSNYRLRVVSASLFALFLILLIAIFLARSIIFPINYIRSILFSMSSGELPSKPVKTASDELGQMGAALNDIIAGLRKKAEFSVEIGKENFNFHFDPLSKLDALGNSLLQMRDSLAQASQEAEIRRIENQQRSWSAQGLANFNELIRNHSDTLEEFTNHTISELCGYLDAQLGGFYVVRKNKSGKSFLSLTAFYAYDRHKFVQKEIELGENLIGQAVLERDTIFISDIPADYVSIVSGLGADKPTSLLIVPLKLNDDVYGVIELASFKLMKTFEVEFVEKVGEIFASTLSNIQIKEQTDKLLIESNEKSERLAQQEQATREKIQKLEQSLQENTDLIREQSKKYANLEAEYKNEINSFEHKLRLSNDELSLISGTYENLQHLINSSMGVIEVTMNGEITRANNKYLQMTGMTLIDIVGKSVDTFIGSQVAKSQDYLDTWQKLRDGEVVSRKNIYFYKGKEKNFYETYTPVKNHKNEYHKIMISSFDLSVIQP